MMAKQRRKTAIIEALLLLLFNRKHGLRNTQAFQVSWCWHPLTSSLPIHVREGWKLSAFTDHMNAHEEEEQEEERDFPRRWDPDLASSNSPSKLDVYGKDELVNLLKIHQDLNQIISKESVPDDESKEASVRNTPDKGSDGAFGGLHDVVLRTLLELEVVEQVIQHPELTSLRTEEIPLATWLPREVQERIKDIRAIASDVDGTITASDQSVHPKTQAAIRRAVAASYSPIDTLRWFFPATGKSKAGVLASLPPDIASLLSKGPGVFIQGLYCVNGEKVVFEKKLPESAVISVERLVAETGTSVIAYDGDTLWTNNLTDTVLELHAIYKEPLSKEISTLSGYQNSFHKVLICDKDIGRLLEVRILLEALAKEHDCVVTQAIPTMLELLPSGCSKALGVRMLCHELGIDPETQLLAVGDAENDVEMLKMAAIGCVVANANELAKNAADVVLPLSSSDGGAGLAFKVLGGV